MESDESGRGAGRLWTKADCLFNDTNNFVSFVLLLEASTHFRGTPTGVNFILAGSNLIIDGLRIPEVA